MTTAGPAGDFEAEGTLADGRSVRIRATGSRIASVTHIAPDSTGRYLLPAFWDIQTNGRGGVSFSDATLRVDEVRGIVREHASLGTGRLCPTLITAAPEATRHGVRTIAEACRTDRLLDQVVVSVHLEGPWISELDGYRGAHPREHVRDPDIREFEALQEAAGGRIGLVTLAPERPGAIAFIGELRRRGVVVALGHTAADGPTLAAAVEAGATLSTHLGNGLVSQLPRHPNPIWHQAAEDRLFASFIADGHHLDDDTLKVLLRAKGLERTILVSDFSPLAGLPPGRYGQWEVRPEGKIVVAGTPYLAGADRGLDIGLARVMRLAGIGLGEAMRSVTANPARLLGRRPPVLAPGEPADLVTLELKPEGTGPRVVVRDIFVAGEHIIVPAG